MHAFSGSGETLREPTCWLGFIWADVSQVVTRFQFDTLQPVQQHRHVAWQGLGQRISQQPLQPDAYAAQRVVIIRVWRYGN